jgi:anti-sigma factor RsiW
LKIFPKIPGNIVIFSTSPLLSTSLLFDFMPSPSRHLDERQLHAWPRRELSPKEQLALSDHLAECPECRRRLDMGSPAVPRSPSLRRHSAAVDPGHLTDDQIAAYAQGKASTEEQLRWAGHLKNCEACRKQVEALTEFKEEMTGYLPRQYEPVERASWLGKLTDSLSSLLRPARWLALSGVAAIAIALCFVAKPLLTSPLPNAGKMASQRHGGESSSPLALVTPSPRILPDHTALLPSSSPETPRFAAADGHAPNGALAASAPVVSSSMIILNGKNGITIGAPSTLAAQKFPAATNTASTPNPLLAGPGPQLLHDSGRLIRVDGHGDLQGGLDEIEHPWIDWVRATLLTGILTFPKTPEQWSRDVDSLGDASAIAQIRSAERNTQLIGARDGSHSHLVMGIVYARYGLMALAQKEFQMLSKDNPDSGLAAQFLRQVTR